MKRSLFLKALFVILIFGFAAFISADSSALRMAKNTEILSRVYNEITLNYVDEIDADKFLLAGISGMLNTLDPYTVFIDDKNKGDLEYITEGKYGGIGVTIGLRNERIITFEVMDGYPAFRQGMRVGDEILRVDGIPFTAANYENISSHLKGDPGTAVSLDVLRPGSIDTLSFRLIREVIQVKNIPVARFLPNEKGIAYIKISGFSRTCGNELRSAVRELQGRKPIQSVILDLRGNPGGLLDMAVEVANVFLPKGSLVVTTRGRSGDSFHEYFAERDPLLPDIPVILLIDDVTASASEIVAGALQDHDRAVILGTPSFGKGLVQTIINLSDESSLKLTSARYFTPSGRCIQKIDYALNNPVISHSDSLSSAQFKTDAQRVVTSKGGIHPDSVVSAPEQSSAALDLLSKGYFSRFSFSFYEQNSSRSFQALSHIEIYDAFTRFLKQENYVLRSDESVKIEELLAAVSRDSSKKELIPQIQRLKADEENVSQKSISRYKTELIKYILIELAERYGGKDQRVFTSLKYDAYFSAAVSLLKNPLSYHSLLRPKKN